VELWFAAQPGSVGDMDGIGLGQDARGWVWAEDGMVLSVITYGGSDELVDQVVASLRVGTDAELEAMRLGPVAREPTAEDAGCPPGTPIVSARRVTCAGRSDSASTRSIPTPGSIRVWR